MKGEASSPEDLVRRAARLDESERGSFLDEECPAHLHPWVEARLLGENAPVTMGPEADGDATLALPGGPEGAAELPPRIGQYRILGAIGSGGMGTVYEAEQESPRRVVALKVLSPTQAGGAVLRRFEYEAQVLAELRHPGIAQIYEAGTHRDLGGVVPYFSMELVPGARPITRYADEEGLDLERRLELFVEVCDAVHHGHLKGIVHRDLKPSNILVDGEGRAKVIDFGVARSISGEAAPETMLTRLGQVVGTLPYMSPEQCGLDGRDVDARSDVYSLGVVLYELLSRRLPYDVETGSLVAAARVIREQAPPPLGVVDRRLRGDVETIVLKALQKAPDRRYQSARELGQELRRFLAGEAVLARRPSLGYQLRVLIRRNRALAAAVAAGLAVLLGGAITSTALYVRAERAAERARLEATRSSQVATFLKDLLAGVGPSVALGRDTTMLREIVERTAERLDDEQSLRGQPEVEGELRRTLGEVYLELGLYERAAPMLERALELQRQAYGDTDLEVARTLETFGLLRRAQGRLDEAETLLRRCLEIRGELLGEESPAVAAALDNVGLVLQERGEYARAESLHRRALEIGERVLGAASREGSEARKTLENLASALRYQGRWSEAEILFRRALEESRSELGDRHPDTLVAMNNLASLFEAQGRFADAEELHRRQVEIATEVLGPEHPNTLTFVNNLAGALSEQGRYGEAETLYRQSLEVSRRSLGADHPSVYQLMNNLAGVLTDVGRYAEAETLYAETLAGRRRLLGAEHPLTLAAANNLAFLYKERGRWEPAERLYREAWDGYRRTLGAEHPSTLVAASNLGELFNLTGRFAEAEAQTRDTLEALRRSVPPEHWLVGSVQRRYGEALAGLGRLDEAQGELLAAHGVLRAALGAEHERTREAARSLARLYTRLGNGQEAASWRRRAGS